MHLICSQISITVVSHNQLRSMEIERLHRTKRSQKVGLFTHFVRSLKITFFSVGKAPVGLDQKVSSFTLSIFLRILKF